jgi:signal transduction histidine kinase
VTPLRIESLKYCLSFALVTLIALIYAGLWSLHTGIDSDQILQSSLDKSIWIICAINLLGFSLSYSFKEKNPAVSSWLLCLTEGISLLILINFSFEPQSIFYFIIPIIFAILLLEWKKSAVFIGIILVSIILVLFNQPTHVISYRQTLFPLALLISFSIVMELIVEQIFAYLTWYQQKYEIASVNEQIIKDNEIKLEKLVNSLEEYKKYLSETNLSLIQARDEAELARNAKQNFVQNVSHELRTPLNLIIGFAETMVNSPRSYGEMKWTPELRGDIELIYRNSQHLKDLIDDILDMASLENRKYEVILSKVNLNSIIHEVVLISENAYKTKGLFLETHLTSHIRKVRGDEVRLKQVLLNLLSNSLKYTNTGGVKISSSTEDQMAYVSVADTGKGIPKEDLEKVFEAFFQIEKSNNRDDYGTGLGLSISKQLIELQGGEMWIESELGNGTTVFFSVPLSPD